MSNRTRRICVALVDRANYGRLRPVMQAIQDHEGLELQVVAAGTMVLERFDQPVRLVEADGFRVDSRVYMELEGSTPTTMAKSLGFGVVELAGEFQRLSPDILMVIGDRYEALAAVLAASFMNIPIAHVQGGEVSGSIDESTRHAISKYAHYHFPSTARSAEFLIRMGERPETVLGIGCPSSDLARHLNLAGTLDFINERGSGGKIETTEPFLLSVFHPTTTEFGTESRQIEALLNALEKVSMPTLMLWPNIDAGSEHMNKAIRIFREHQRNDWLRILTNLPPEEYLQVLSQAACAVGNSSSFVRDSSYFGTPIVLVGNRQYGRETAGNVTTVPVNVDAIAGAIAQQLAHGSYPASDLYGDGRVSERIAERLAKVRLYVQKSLSFIDD